MDRGCLRGGAVVSDEADELRKNLAQAEATIADLRKCNAVLATMIRDMRHEHSESAERWIEQFGRERDQWRARVRELEARQ